jgi:hypothetical protein
VLHSVHTVAPEELEVCLAISNWNWNLTSFSRQMFAHNLNRKYHKSQDFQHLLWRNEGILKHILSYLAKESGHFDKLHKVVDYHC